MMKKGEIILWIVVSVLCAVAFGFVTGLLNPAEKVNALWLVVAAACFFALGYRFYGAFLASKVATLDDTRITPAHRFNDGKNFHPTNKWVLFGHHFAAIAGAGPLLGPVLAAQFGYLPGFLWIVIGSVLAGAVHDFIILVASTRRDGRSLVQIAREEIGPIAGMATTVVVLFVVIIALAGLGLAVVNALYHNPWGTFTIAMTIPIAFLMGFYLTRWRPGKVWEVSAIGCTLLIAAVVVGRLIPGSQLEPFFNFGKGTITFLLAAYGFIASVLPVWMLLCPRDYLSTFMKVGVVSLLALGVILLAPVVHLPPVTKFLAGGGPVFAGTVFPFVFITIACGSFSGFHSLISSGTTPKMLHRESEAWMIGYGGMLMEGFVGVVALVAASILEPGDLFAINSTLSSEQLAALGFAPVHVHELSDLVGVDVASRPGGAVSLAVGMASIFSSLPGMAGLMAYWYQFALLFEALFILTTIDTGTRVARFLLQEMGGVISPKFKEFGWLPGNLIASFLVVAAWGFFIYTGRVSDIWPMFGVANQLLGVLALCVGTTVIITMGKARYIWTTVLPLALIAATTLTAAYRLFVRFWVEAHAATAPETVFRFSLDAFLMAMLGGLVIVIMADSLYRWFGYLILKNPLPASGASPAPPLTRRRS